MSDYESHSGKLRSLPALEDETFEEHCLRIWIENGKSEDTYEKGCIFNDYDLHDKYLYIDDEIWEIFDHEELGPDDDSYCRLQPNSDGSISFHTRFYNGGTYLIEMLEDELKDL